MHFDDFVLVVVILYIIYTVSYSKCDLHNSDSDSDDGSIAHTKGVDQRSKFTCYTCDNFVHIPEGWCFIMKTNHFQFTSGQVPNNIILLRNWGKFYLLALCQNQIFVMFNLCQCTTMSPLSSI